MLILEVELKLELKFKLFRTGKSQIEITSTTITSNLCFFLESESNWNH